MQKIDFSHRLSSGVTGKDLTSRELADSVGVICSRATSIIELIAAQFEQEGRRVNDSVIAESLYAVSNEIMDMRAMVEAFHEQSIPHNGLIPDTAGFLYT